MSSSQKVFYQSRHQQDVRKLYNKSPHQQTFQLVRQSLKETNNLAKERLLEQLRAEKERSQQGKVELNVFRVWLTSLRYNLYLEPTIISWISLYIGLIFITLSLLVSLLIAAFKVNHDPFIGQLALILVCLFLICLLIWPILIFFLTVITPKLEIDWEQRWKQTKYQYLKKMQDNNKLAKGNIKRAITYYRNKNQVLRFLWNLLWGIILIGCIPDNDFQNALISVVEKAWKGGLSSIVILGAISEIYKANPFGLAAILAFPFVGFFYLWNYRIPINWLENILSIIEFEEEMELDYGDAWSEQDQIDATNYSLQYISSFYLDDDEENNT